MKRGGTLPVPGGGPMASRSFRVVLAAGFLCATAAPLHAALGILYQVTTTADSGDGSLRQAIIDANNDGQESGIRFALTDGQVIRPTTPLPALLELTRVTGPAPGPDGPVVEISGSSAIGGSGLTLSAVGCVVRNLKITDWDNGIEITGNGFCTVAGCHIGSESSGNTVGIRISSQNNTVGGTQPGDGNVISGNGDGVFLFGAIGNVILGNRIGTDASGSRAIPNINGIHSGASGTTVGGIQAGAGNLISGNSGRGIFINGGFGNLIQGNIVGLAADGHTPLPNGVGIDVRSSNNNTIGGNTPGARNIISGNGNSGILIALDNAINNVIRGDFIGTDITGTQAAPNGFMGIEIHETMFNEIGGEMPGDGNLISGNTLSGIFTFHGNSNAIHGNRIGTDVTGMAALPNGRHGIELSTCTATPIGGNTPGLRNLISGNSEDGIHIDDFDGPGTGNAQITGNWIGVDASGLHPLSNGGAGIFLNSTNSRIGGPSSPEGNVIAGNGGHGVVIGSRNSVVVQANQIGVGADRITPIGNGGDGVRVLTAELVFIFENFIANNGGLGIDLGGDGYTQNDPGDGDTGPNTLQNSPFVSGNLASMPAVFDGVLGSTPNSIFTVEVFVSQSPDPSGRGEGAFPLFAFQAATDDLGVAHLHQEYGGPLPEGRYISATASSADGNTSEFSLASLDTGRGPTTQEIVDFLLGLIPDPGDLDVNSDNATDVADAVALLHP
jgi:hypothetical protein